MMRCARTILLLTVLTIAVLPCVAQAPEPPPADGTTPQAAPVLLHFCYEEGEVLTYKTTVDGVGSVHVMGQAQPIEMSGAMEVVTRIESVDEEGNFTIVTDVDITELSVTMAGSPVPPPKQDIQMRTKMSPRGEILDMQLTQAVNQPGSETPWNAEITKLLTGGFDLNRMMLGQKVAAFPEEAVKPGDQWLGAAPEVEVQGQTAPLEITTKYVNNIELQDRECAVLDSATSLQPGALGELATMLGMQGSTTTQTRTWFDIEAGRMLASMEKTQVNMQVTIPAAMTGGAGGAGVFLEMFVDTESKLLPSDEE